MNRQKKFVNLSDKLRDTSLFPLYSKSRNKELKNGKGRWKWTPLQLQAN